jgi:hypothetical protein
MDDASKGDREETEAASDVERNASGGFRLVQAFGRALEIVWSWEFGSTPTKNGLKRFSAAFFGAYVGIFPLGISWIYFMSLWEAFKSFLSTLIAAEHVIVIAVAAIIVVPTLISIILGWVISTSSKDESTMLTLFVRGLAFDFLLFILFLAVLGVSYSVKSGTGLIADWRAR